MDYPHFPMEFGVSQGPPTTTADIIFLTHGNRTRAVAKPNSFDELVRLTRDIFSIDNVIFEIEYVLLDGTVNRAELDRSAYHMVWNRTHIRCVLPSESIATASQPNNCNYLQNLRPSEGFDARNHRFLLKQSGESGSSTATDLYYAVTAAHNAVDHLANVALKSQNSAPISVASVFDIGMELNKMKKLISHQLSGAANKATSTVPSNLSNAITFARAQGAVIQSLARQQQDTQVTNLKIPLKRAALKNLQGYRTPQVSDNSALHAGKGPGSAKQPNTYVLPPMPGHLQQPTGDARPYLSPTRPPFMSVKDNSIKSSSHNLGGKNITNDAIAGERPKSCRGRAYYPFGRFIDVEAESPADSKKVSIPLKKGANHWCAVPSPTSQLKATVEDAPDSEERPGLAKDDIAKTPSSSGSESGSWVDDETHGSPDLAIEYGSDQSGWVVEKKEDGHYHCSGW